MTDTKELAQILRDIADWIDLTIHDGDAFPDDGDVCREAASKLEEMEKELRAIDSYIHAGDSQ